MKRWIGLAARFYPQAWRERYGDEFDALLEDVQPGRKQFIDVLRGALKMQMTNAAAYWKLIGAIAVAGAIIAIAASFATPALYQSTAVMRVASPQNSEGVVSTEQVSLNQIEQEVLSRASLEGLIMQPDLDLYKNERARIPMEKIVQDMRNRDIQIRMVSPLFPLRGRGAAFAISFAYPDQRKAQAVVRELTDRFTEINAALNQSQEHAWQKIWPQSAPPPPAGNLELLDAASEPQRPLNPNRLEFAAWGLSSGLALGLLAAIAMQRPKWTLQMAGFAMGGLALTVALLLLLPETYISTAVMRATRGYFPESLAAAGVPDTPLPERLQWLQQAVFSDASLEKTITTPSLDLYHKQRARTPINEAVSGMRRDLSVRILNPPQGSPSAGSVFSISFSYPDPYKAQAVVRAVLTQFIIRNVEFMRAQGVNLPEDSVARRIIDAKLADNLEVLDPSSLPELPVGPNRRAISAAGFGVGLLFGAITLRLRRRGAQTLRTA